jgi:hypothetical protein
MLTVALSACVATLNGSLSVGGVSRIKDFGGRMYASGRTIMALRPRLGVRPVSPEGTGSSLRVSEN